MSFLTYSISSAAEAGDVLLINMGNYFMKLFFLSSVTWHHSLKLGIVVYL